MKYLLVRSHWSPSCNIEYLVLCLELMTFQDLMTELDYQRQRLP